MPVGAGTGVFLHVCRGFILHTSPKSSHLPFQRLLLIGAVGLSERESIPFLPDFFRAFQFPGLFVPWLSPLYLQTALGLRFAAWSGSGPPWIPKSHLSWGRRGCLSSARGCCAAAPVRAALPLGSRCLRTGGPSWQLLGFSLGLFLNPAYRHRLWAFPFLRPDFGE